MFAVTELTLNYIGPITLAQLRYVEFDHIQFLVSRSIVLVSESHGVYVVVYDKSERWKKEKEINIYIYTEHVRNSRTIT
jgi:hypothetical protein